MLVAPVRIGAGATIGAGSTITAAAPEGKLTLARARQVTVEGWKRPRKRASSAQNAAARSPKSVARGGALKAKPIKARPVKSNRKAPAAKPNRPATRIKRGAGNAGKPSRR